MVVAVVAAVLVVEAVAAVLAVEAVEAVAAWVAVAAVEVDLVEDLVEDLAKAVAADPVVANLMALAAKKGISTATNTCCCGM